MYGNCFDAAVLPDLQLVRFFFSEYLYFIDRPNRQDSVDAAHSDTNETVIIFTPMPE